MAIQRLEIILIVGIMEMGLQAVCWDLTKTKVGK